MESISFMQPLDRAMRRTGQMLFHPFDMGKWCVLGFSAWLATLGDYGGFAGWGDDFFGSKENIAHWPHAFMEHLSLFVPLIGGIVLVIFAISLVLAWLTARGRFMFLDNVVGDRARVREPWNQFRLQGNSLFLWSLVFGLLLLLAVAVVATAGILMAIPAIKAKSLLLPSLLGVTASCFLLFLIAIVGLYVGLFLIDFVTPIMWKHSVTTNDAWRRFLPLFKKNIGLFLVYGLIRFLIRMVTSIMVAAFIVLTCCCGFVLLAIPYVGAVIMLPITVFVRLYSVEFLKQFGPEFDATNIEPPPLTSEAQL